MDRRKRVLVCREITELVRDIVKIPVRRFEEAEAGQPLVMARNMLKQIISETFDDGKRS